MKEMDLVVCAGVIGTAETRVTGMPMTLGRGVTCAWLPARHLCTFVVG